LLKSTIFRNILKFFQTWIQKSEAIKGGKENGKWNKGEWSMENRKEEVPKVPQNLRTPGTLSTLVTLST